MPWAVFDVRKTGPGGFHDLPPGLLTHAAPEPLVETPQSPVCYKSW
jgi:hypothetical protein